MNSVFCCFAYEINKMLPKPWFSKPMFGHSVGPTELDQPHCKQFRLTYSCFEVATQAQSLVDGQQAGVACPLDIQRRRDDKKKIVFRRGWVVYCGQIGRKLSQNTVFLRKFPDNEIVENVQIYCGQIGGKLSQNTVFLRRRPPDHSSNLCPAKTLAT